MSQPSHITRTHQSVSGTVPGSGRAEIPTPTPPPISTGFTATDDLWK